MSWKKIRIRLCNVPEPFGRATFCNHIKATVIIESSVVHSTANRTPFVERCQRLWSTKSTAFVRETWSLAIVELSGFLLVVEYPRRGWVAVSIATIVVGVAIVGGALRSLRKLL